MALKVLRGETRPSQLKNAPSPQDPPDKPDDLDAAASRVWDRVMAAIEQSRHIGQAHADTLRAYCEAVAASSAMRPKGTKEWRELISVQRQYARELCLTPATGGHLTSAKPPASKLDKYVTRAG